MSKLQEHALTVLDTGKRDMVESASSKIDLTGLNHKQKKFCLAYPSTGSSTKAAELAGYCSGTQPGPKKTARLRMTVVTLMRNHKIKRNINILNAHMEQFGVATALQIKLFWTTIMDDECSDQKLRLEASKLMSKCYPDFAEKIVMEQHATVQHEHHLKPVFQNLSPGALGRSLGIEITPDLEVIDVESQSTPISIEDVL